MATKQFYLVAAILLHISVPCTAEEITKDYLKQLEQEMKQSTLVLQPTINGARTVYFNTDNGRAFLVHDPRSRLHLRSEIMVTFDDLSGDASMVDLEIKSRTFGKGHIYFYPPP